MTPLGKGGHTLKGQHLFVRPVESADYAPLRELYEADQVSPPEPLIAPLALIAKLAGTIVAHAVAVPKGTDLEIIHLYVARDLRRKRVGRSLLIELEELAGRMQCSRLIAAVKLPFARFLTNAGFISRGRDLEKAVRLFPSPS